MARRAGKASRALPLSPRLAETAAARRMSSCSSLHSAAETCSTAPGKKETAGSPARCLPLGTTAAASLGGGCASGSCTPISSSSCRRLCTCASVAADTWNWGKGGLSFGHMYQCQINGNRKAIEAQHLTELIIWLIISSSFIFTFTLGIGLSQGAPQDFLIQLLV